MEPETHYIPTAIILFNESERKAAEGVVHRMVKKAVELEGTVTGEHGVGLIKRDYLEHELGESTVDVMRRVSLQLVCRVPYSNGTNSQKLDVLTLDIQLKLALDPLRLLNCDKVVRVEQPLPGEVKEW